MPDFRTEQCQLATRTWMLRLQRGGGWIRFVTAPCQSRGFACHTRPPETTTSMSLIKALASSLSGISTIGYLVVRVLIVAVCAIVKTTVKLLAKRLWCRSLQKTRGIISGGASPRAPRTTCSSPAARLPLEILEMIIVHLIYETANLLACSLTCYSWNIATIPHLHHTLIIKTCNLHADEEFVWPEPLQNMQKFGLLPLVKMFQVYGKPYHVGGFSPRLFDRNILHCFSALINIQELGIDYLNTPEFLPGAWRYFGHFSPTVRSLALREPKGSRRQIIHFIGLFQHLEDLKLLYQQSDPQEEPANDLTLIPLFAPPLRGQLTMTSFTRVELLKDMIDLFGGLRFCRMNLCNVNGMRLLLDTCANTLETLRLYPGDPRGEGFSL